MYKNCDGLANAVATALSPRQSSLYSTNINDKIKLVFEAWEPERFELELFTIKEN